MPKYELTLGNSGGIEYNDVIFDQTFDLNKSKYRIVLNPKTMYWRFGIRFGATPDFLFYHSSGRYNNPDFPNVEPNAGKQIDFREWSEENRIELGPYDIKNFHDSLLDLWEYHEPKAPIEISFKKNEMADSLTLTYHVGNRHVFGNDIIIPGIRFFKVFPWAGDVAYEVEVSIISEYNTPHFSNGYYLFS